MLQGFQKALKNEIGLTVNEFLDLLIYMSKSVIKNTPDRVCDKLVFADSN